MLVTGGIYHQHKYLHRVLLFLFPHAFSGAMSLPSSEGTAPANNPRLANALARQSIVALAEVCRDSLQKSCRLLNDYRDDGTRSIKMRDLVGRFNVWASSTGALATLHASLDYRLRDLPDVKELLLDHLRNMADLIRQCKPVFSRNLKE